MKKIGKNEYDAVMVGQIFNYLPEKTHGFQIPGTNVNAMIVPGEVNHISYTFTKPGTYLVLCNEYCGTGHESMYTTITVQ